MSIIIYHNPRCSKSRQTLAILDKNRSPYTIVEYLKNPPSVKTLKLILNRLDMGPRDIMRKSEAAYKNLGLSDPKFPKDKLIKTMSEYPELIERPIVIRGEKAVIGRPPENVLLLLK
tara:strand:- start:5038 stop:5388 length:351 start_codon:yes stop_codon:yes gene_type:complete